MNKLEIFSNRSIPFEWDDLDWLQESVRDAFYGLLSAFGIDPEDSFIISGCVVTITLGPNSAATTAGWLSLDGEILKVDAHTVSFTTGQSINWEVEETNDITGTETDINGATVQCYKVRRAKLTPGVSSVGKMSFLAGTLQAILKAQVFDHETAWTQLTLTEDYGHVTDNPVKYRRNKAGNVDLIGYFTATTADGGTLGTLPAGFRPSQEQRTMIMYDSYALLSGPYLQEITIGTNGVITIPAGHAATTINNYISTTLFI